MRRAASSRAVFVKLFLISLGVACFPIFLHAHAGLSLEEKIGEYLVDVGYGYWTPMAGERLVLDFSLQTVDTRNNVPFDSVRARIKYEDEIVLATEVGKPSIGSPTILWVLPENISGELEVQVTYNRAGESLVQTTFTLPVMAAPWNLYDYVPYIGAVLLGAVLGAIGSVVLIRQKLFS